jgi:hypothetical protein
MTPTGGANRERQVESKSMTRSRPEREERKYKLHKESFKFKFKVFGRNSETIEMKFVELQLETDARSQKKSVLVHRAEHEIESDEMLFLLKSGGDQASRFDPSAARDDQPLTTSFVRIHHPILFRTKKELFHPLIIGHGIIIYQISRTKQQYNQKLPFSITYFIHHEIVNYCIATRHRSAPFIEQRFSLHAVIEQRSGASFSIDNGL